MRRTIICGIALLIAGSAYSQHANTDSIVAEGKRLYRSEMASWYGTDIFLEKFPEKKDRFEGYFSYDRGTGASCVFYTKDELPDALVTITFDSTFSVESALIDTQQRKLSDFETEMVSLRRKARQIVNSDTLFTAYKNTSLNLIPLISNGEHKVYVLTGPKVSGVVLLGNDYLMRFNKQSELLDKRMLHQNLIAMEYKGNPEKDVFGTIHTHLKSTGDFITATDICTLMLYGKFTPWKQHLVVSENFISIWRFEDNTLITMTREAWKKFLKTKKKNKNNMKRTFTTSILVFGFLVLSATAGAQATFTLPANIQLEAKEDYAKYEPDIVNAAKWLEETDLDKEMEKRQEVNAFVLQWVTGSPTVSVEIGEKLMKLYGDNVQLLAIYIASYCRHMIENKETATDRSAIKAGLMSMMTVYKRKIEIKKSKEMEKLIKLAEKQKLDEYVIENFGEKK